MNKIERVLDGQWQIFIVTFRGWHRVIYHLLLGLPWALFLKLYCSYQYAMSQQCVSFETSYRY